MEKFKKCSICREWKAVDDFHLIRTTTDGLYPHCKTCSLNLIKSSFYIESTKTRMWLLKNYGGRLGEYIPYVKWTFRDSIMSK